MKKFLNIWIYTTSKPAVEKCSAPKYPFYFKFKKNVYDGILLKAQKDFVVLQLSTFIEKSNKLIVLTQ